MAQLSLENLLKRKIMDAKFRGKGEDLISLEKGHGKNMLHHEEVTCLFKEGQCMRVATVDSTMSWDKSQSLVLIRPESCLPFIERVLESTLLWFGKNVL